jgi:hypothetical protein
MFSWRYGVIGDSLFPAWERSLPLLDEHGNQVHCDRFDNILVLQRRWTKPGQVDHWRRHAGVDETRFEVDNEGTTFVTVARAADQLVVIAPDGESTTFALASGRAEGFLRRFGPICKGG